MLIEEPYEVGRLVHLPGKYVVCIHVSLSSKALSQARILEEAINIINELDVPVISIKASKLKPEARGQVSMFIDLTNRSEAIKSLVEKLKNIGFIEDVRIVEPIIKGITIDNTSPYPTLLGNRVVMFMKPYYEAMIKTLLSLIHI